MDKLPVLEFHESTINAVPLDPVLVAPSCLQEQDHSSLTVIYISEDKR